MRVCIAMFSWLRLGLLRRNKRPTARMQSPAPSEHILLASIGYKIIQEQEHAFQTALRDTLVVPSLLFLSHSSAASSADHNSVHLLLFH